MSNEEPEPLKYECRLGEHRTVLDPDGCLQSAASLLIDAIGWPGVDATVGEIVRHPFVDLGRDKLSPAIPYRKLPLPRIGEFVVPTGLTRYARGLFLIDDHAALAIRDEPNEPLQLIITAGGESVEFRVWPLSPMLIHGRPLPPKEDPEESPGDEGNEPEESPLPPPSSVYLLPVVDFRYRWSQHRAKLIGRGPDYPGSPANKPEEDSESDEPLGNRTWQELIDDLLDTLPKPPEPEDDAAEEAPAPNDPTVTLPHVRPTLGFPDPRQFVDVHPPLAAAIDLTIVATGHRALSVDGTEVTIATAEETKERIKKILKNNPTMMGGPGVPAPQRDQIRIVGPRLIQYIPTGTWTTDDEDVSGTVQGSFGSGQGGTGSEESEEPIGEPLTVFTTWFYNENLNGIRPKTKTPLRRAMESIRRIWTEWKIDPADLRIPGIVPIHDCAAFDFVRYCYRSDDISTAAITFDPAFFPRAMINQGPDARPLPAIVDGLVSKSTVINESVPPEDGKPIVIQTPLVKVRIFDPSEKIRSVERIETKIEVSAAAGIIGELQTGVWASVASTPEGRWTMITAGCEPLLPEYEPSDLNEEE